MTANDLRNIFEEILEEEPEEVQKDQQFDVLGAAKRRPRRMMDAYREAIDGAMSKLDRMLIKKYLVDYLQQCEQEPFAAWQSAFEAYGIFDTSFTKLPEIEAVIAKKLYDSAKTYNELGLICSKTTFCAEYISQAKERMSKMQPTQRKRSAFHCATI